MSQNKDKNNEVILAAEIANLALSVDEDTIKTNPKKTAKILKTISKNIKKLQEEQTKDPHKDDPNISYEMAEKRLDLEEQLAKIMKSPHRQSNEWYMDFWPVITAYMKLMNSSLFRTV